ncbi:MAG: Rieske (2Fe-2S) protein [Steroidobacteraceae bacterium]
MSESTFIRIAHISDVRKGGVLEINLGSRNILLCHTREGWFAVDNICTHAYARLSEGRLRKTRLICPLHGGAFDCRSGAALGPPAVVPLKTYPVRVIGEEVQIAFVEHPAGS